MSFRHIGGDIFWRTRPLSEGDVAYFKMLFSLEGHLAARANDEAGFAQAHALLDELIEAQTQQQQWRRAAEIRKAA